jgi:hypothetical protein
MRLAPSLLSLFPKQLLFRNNGRAFSRQRSRDAFQIVSSQQGRDRGGTPRSVLPRVLQAHVVANMADEDLPQYDSDSDSKWPYLDRSFHQCTCWRPSRGRGTWRGQRGASQSHVSGPHPAVISRLILFPGRAPPLTPPPPPPLLQRRRSRQPPRLASRPLATFPPLPRRSAISS